MLQGLLVIAIGALLAWTARVAKRRADDSGLSSRTVKLLQENWAYVRRGFRRIAVLDLDHIDKLARGAIGKSAPPPVAKDAMIVRVDIVMSRRGQRLASFAAQMYKRWVPYCASHGWSALEIEGYAPSDALLPGQKLWTVRLKNADGQMCVIIQPGWSPISDAAVTSDIGNDIWKEAMEGMAAFIDGTDVFHSS